MAKRFFDLCSLIALLLASQEPSPGQGWHSIGPPSVPYSMCAGPGYILLGTPRAGIARSTNDGIDWNFVADMPPRAGGSLPSNIVASLAHDPWTSSVVYAGLGQEETAGGFGVFKSIDGGANWTAVGSGLPAQCAVPAIAMNPFHMNEIYLNVRCEPGSGLYRSSDGGTTWTGYASDTYQFQSSILFDGTDSTVQYAIGGDGAIHAWKNGVYSRIAPATNIATGARVTAFLNPVTKSLFYVYLTGLYRCAHDGNWISLLENVPGGGASVSQISSAGIDSRTGAVFVCTDCGVFRSLDDGSQWRLVNPSEDMSINVDSGRMLLIGYSGTYVSTDGGDVWSRTAEGPAISPVYDISLSSSPAGDVVFALTEDTFSWGSSLFKSTNDGKNWTKLRLPNSASPSSLKSNPVNPNVVYAGGWVWNSPLNGLYRSEDGGLSWRQVLADSTVPVTAIDISQADTSRVLLGTPGRVWESTNSGKTWDVLLDMGSGSTHYETNVVRVSEAHPSLILAGTSCNDESLSGVFVTTDDGYHWNFRVAGLPLGLDGKDIMSLAVSPSNDSVIFAGNWISVFRSSDQGLTWNSCAFPARSYRGHIDDIQCAPDDPSLVCATVFGDQVGEGGLFMSTNGGSSWSEVPFPVIADKSRTKIRIQPSGDKYRIYVGTLSYGCYEGEIPRNVASTGCSTFRPATTILFQNYPNPFNPVTTLRYGIARMEQVTLNVYNNLGQCVRVLVQSLQEPGVYEVRFDGSDLASGVYYYRLQAGEYVETKTLLLIR